MMVVKPVSRNKKSASLEEGRFFLKVGLSDSSIFPVETSKV
jgi:hypothetical protein